MDDDDGGDWGDCIDMEQDFLQDFEPLENMMGPPEEFAFFEEPDAGRATTCVTLPLAAHEKCDTRAGDGSTSPSRAGSSELAASSAEESVPAPRSSTPEGQADSVAPAEPTARDPARQPPALTGLDSSTSPPQWKRVRLTKKTAVPEGAFPHAPRAPQCREAKQRAEVGSYVPGEQGVYAAAKQSLRVSQEFWQEGEYKKLAGRSQRGVLYDRVRNFWAVHLARCSSLKEAAARLPAKVAARRHLFVTLPKPEQTEAAEAWVVCTKAPPWLALFVQQVFVPETEMNGKADRVKSALLTWVGPWKLPNPCAEPTAGAPRVALHVLVEKLRETPKILELWDRIMEHADKVRSSLGASDWAICMEVCPEVYALQGTLQVHFHMFLRSPNWMSLRRAAWMHLDGAGPNVARAVGGLAASRAQGNWSGYFYCCVDKDGHLFHRANRRPFKDFLVNASWILNLVQARKLCVEKAKALVRQCVSGAYRTLQELRLQDDLLEAEALAEEKLAIQDHLHKQLSTWKTFSVVQTWQAQYASILQRYKFLILSGPSRMGKTVFARSLCDPSKQVLEVNCASGREPDLRAYRIRTHDLILFDEIEAPAVAAQRKLFQAPAAEVQLGCSATNCHSYTVWTHRRKFVLATNNWASSLKCVSAADREWIAANSLLLNVDAPMWL